MFSNVRIGFNFVFRDTLKVPDTETNDDGNNNMNHNKNNSKKIDNKNNKNDRSDRSQSDITDMEDIQDCPNASFTTVDFLTANTLIVGDTQGVVSILYTVLVVLCYYGTNYLTMV